MPDWPEVLDLDQSPAVPAAAPRLPTFPVEPLPVPRILQPQTFCASVQVSEQLLAQTAAVKADVLDRLRREIAGEMRAMNHEPIGGEVLEWEADPQYLYRRYTLTQEGLPAQARWSP